MLHMLRPAGLIRLAIQREANQTRQSSQIFFLNRNKTTSHVPLFLIMCVCPPLCPQCVREKKENKPRESNVKDTEGENRQNLCQRGARRVSKPSYREKMPPHATSRLLSSFSAGDGAATSEEIVNLPSLFDLLTTPWQPTTQKHTSNATLQQ